MWEVVRAVIMGLLIKDLVFEGLLHMGKVLSP